MTFLITERSLIENSFLTKTEIEDVGIVVLSSPSANPKPPFPELQAEALKLG